MPSEPATKRTVAFIDGQNLYRSAKDAFGHHWPSYDVRALARKICSARSWELSQVRFYTGVPDAADDPFWHVWWAKKLAAMGKLGVHVFSRPLRYRNEEVKLPGGATTTVLVGREKGIDVRLALDVVRLALDSQYDVALIFSQDQDLSEAADEVKTISIQQNRWIKRACAFPVSPTTLNKRGINNTDWIRIDRAMYETCLDPNDYRLKKK